MRPGTCQVRRLTATVLLLSVTTACMPRQRPRAPGAPPPRGWSQTGIASWYGPGHHGKRTASGERFDQNALTAAHPWLPFGTRVRVTSLTNGRRVSVRINDRMSRRDRIIDLSRGAARRIGLIGPGTGKVRIVVE